MAGDNHLGFFGKIPTKGDFVSRALPRTFVDPWDLWLQKSIASSREQLTDHWLDGYLTSPIWRFALSRGVCGDNAWIGLMIPSVDRVGRYFPLTLAAPVNNAYTLLFIADHEDPWFSQVEHAALSALDQNNNFDEFTKNIDDLDLPKHLHMSTSTPEQEIPKPELASNGNWRVTKSEPGSVSANLSALTEQFLLQSFPNFSLWWTSGSEKVEPSILICNKLPPAQGFSALLTANWEHWGWNNTLSNQPSPVKFNSENSDSTKTVTTATPVTS